MEPIFALHPRVRIEVIEKLEADGLALAHARLDVVGGEGDERLAVSRGTIVSRRQPDGTWRIVLDNPMTPE